MSQAYVFPFVKGESMRKGSDTNHVNRKPSFTLVQIENTSGELQALEA